MLIRTIIGGYTRNPMCGVCSVKWLKRNYLPGPIVFGGGVICYMQLYGGYGDGNVRYKGCTKGFVGCVLNQHYVCVCAFESRIDTHQIMTVMGILSIFE